MRHFGHEVRKAAFSCGSACGFFSKKMIRLEVDVVMLTQKRNISAPKVERLFLKVQCVLGLRKESKTFCERG